MVYTDLSSALGLANGGYYPDDAKDDDKDNNHGHDNNGGSNEITIGPGGVVVLHGGQVQNVPGGQVPGALKNALNNGTLHDMPGH